MKSATTNIHRKPKMKLTVRVGSRSNRESLLVREKRELSGSANGVYARSQFVKMKENHT